MSKKNKPVNAVVALLDEAGATYRVEGKKHAKVFWSLNGHEFIVVVGATPSDHRALQNALSLVKRQLREAGHAV